MHHAPIDFVDPCPHEDKRPQGHGLAGFHP
jgi:hypothetical protein